VQEHVGQPEVHPVAGKRQFRQFIGYQRVEFSRVLEDNHAINQTVERVGAVRYQTYRIYQKAIA